ncbi:hypothetical protein KFE25_005088 [Diacronema lutheri]|uniref:Uncharacterized protein n=2 Tax=Diacronema lutheri TaxID=2081491 RepID=A0A8J5X8Y6_DIALT|nr:hypothetical protein KFE25_005088 [Diacronema lutheri]
MATNAIDEELAQQEALLADMPLGAEDATAADEAILAPPANAGGGGVDDDDDEMADDHDAAHPRRRRASATSDMPTPPASGGALADTPPERHPIAGARRIIRRTLEPDGSCAAAGIDPLDPEEVRRRDARTEKFGPTTEATAGLSKKREERMKKFGMDAPEPEAPAPLPPAKPIMTLVSQEDVAKMEARARKFEVEQPDPLDVVEKRAQSARGYWEKRRRALPSETPRLDAVYVYGVDKMSTNELLLLFGAHAPQWVEWINDSSANVVFASADAATAALEGSTVMLWAPTVDAALMDDQAPGPDGGTRAPAAVRAMQAWRTLPDAKAHAGKGLQLLFRLSSEQDVKPEVRRPSRWYGETERKGRGGRGGRGAGGARAARRIDGPPRATLVVALGTPEPDLRGRLGLGKRARAEGDGGDGDGGDAAREGAPAMADAHAAADAAMPTPTESAAPDAGAADGAADGGSVEPEPRAAKRRATERGPVLSRLGPRKGAPADAAPPSSGGDVPMAMDGATEEGADRAGAGERAGGDADAAVARDAGIGGAEGARAGPVEAAAAAGSEALEDSTPALPSTDQ